MSTQRILGFVSILAATLAGTLDAVAMSVAIASACDQPVPSRQRRRQLRVIVLDPQGKPLPDAEVTLALGPKRRG